MTACLSLGRAFPVGLALFKRVNIASLGGRWVYVTLTCASGVYWPNCVAGGDPVRLYRELESELQFRRTILLLKSSCKCA